MVNKGVVWNIGWVYCNECEIYNFDLLFEQGYKNFVFINLQQFYFEKFIVEEIWVQ